MKVLNPRSAFLSDYEVLMLLEEMEAAQQGIGSSKAGLDVTSRSGEKKLEDSLRKVPENLRTIQYKTMATLRQPDRPCHLQSADHIRSFQSALRRAGFIGGRRGTQAPNEHQLESAATSKKRKATGRGSSRKKSRRNEESIAAADDEDDAQEEDEDYEQMETDHAATTSSGPGEILPDRALTKAERLQLVNHVPANLVELMTVVEEVYERFTEDQVNELLELIQTYLPLPFKEGEVAAAHNAGELDEEEHDEDPDATQANNGLFMGGDDGGEDYVDEQAEDHYVDGGDREAGVDDMEGAGDGDDE